MSIEVDLSTSKEVTEKYDEFLGYDKPFGKYKFSIIADEVRNISGLNPKMNVLEVASGTGELAFRLSEISRNYYSSDINKNMLNLQRTKLQNSQINNVVYVVADALNLPFIDNYFDVTIERNILLLYNSDFFYDGTAEKTLKEMLRVTKNKVVIIHEYDSPLLLFKKKDPKVHYFKESEIRDLLEKSGLVDIKVVYVTHSTKQLFTVFGEYSKILESFLRQCPFLKKFGGSIIACGSKPI